MQDVWWCLCRNQKHDFIQESYQLSLCSWSGSAGMAEGNRSYLSVGWTVDIQGILIKYKLGQYQVFGIGRCLKVNWGQKGVEQTRKMNEFTGCGLILIWRRWDIKKLPDSWSQVSTSYMFPGRVLAKNRICRSFHTGDWINTDSPGFICKLLE